MANTTRMSEEIQSQEEITDVQPSEVDQELDLELDTEEVPEVQEPPKTEGGKKKFEDMDKDELLAETKRYYAIAHKPKTQPTETPKTKKSDNSEGNIELIEFFAKGNSREDYQKLQVIMKGTGLSMTEAMADPLYQSYKEKKDKEARDEKAQLGVSHSSSTSSDNSFKPGMSAEEHKEAWKKLNQK